MPPLAHHIWNPGVATEKFPYPSLLHSLVFQTFQYETIHVQHRSSSNDRLARQWWVKANMSHHRCACVDKHNLFEKRVHKNYSHVYNSPKQTINFLSMVIRPLSKSLIKCTFWNCRTAWLHEQVFSFYLIMKTSKMEVKGQVKSKLGVRNAWKLVTIHNTVGPLLRRIYLPQAEAVVGLSQRLVKRTFWQTWLFDRHD